MKSRLAERGLLGSEPGLEWQPKPEIAGNRKQNDDGGGRGIRTPDTLSGIAVFKTACFNRSHIPPREV